VDLAAAAMRFPLESPVVASMLIGAASPSIVERNISSLAYRPLALFRVRAVRASLNKGCRPRDRFRTNAFEM
jgi:aryl-alcohol dehydrogenase-like predicted oxidoreductase